jgi:pentatricopeptide repeat protein
MIKSCQKTKDAEKALDLFHQMTDSSIPQTRESFNALIRACGVRRDYYLHSFTLFNQMINEGFIPNADTFNA